MPKRFNKSRKPLTYKQTKAVGKIARKEIYSQSELKNVDKKEDPLAAIGTTSANLTIQMPSKGLTVSDRIGDGIYLKSVQIRGDIDCGSVTTSHARVIAVQDLQSDLDCGEITLQDVLESPEGDRHLNSFYQHNPPRRFKVLSDKHYFWDAHTASAPQPYDLSFKNFGKRKLVLDNTAESGNIGTLKIFCCGGSGGTVDMRNIVTRIKYYDN